MIGRKRRRELGSDTAAERPYDFGCQALAGQQLDRDLVSTATPNAPCNCRPPVEKSRIETV